MTRQYIRRNARPAQKPTANLNAVPEGETQTIEREPVRTPVREDPRERAARRAAELRAHGGLDRENRDKFEAPPAPDGWEYEWRRIDVLGKPDPSYQVDLAQKGFELVDASRHPEMMPKGYTGPIVVDGLGLFERPKEISDEARTRAYRKATGQVRSMEMKNAGQRDDGFDNTYRGKPIAEVKRSYGEPIKEGLSIPNE
jgi:hypothetical protein